MERLQAAIEKARAQRESANQRPVTPADAALSLYGPTPQDGTAPEGTTAAPAPQDEATHATAPSKTPSELWAQLPEIQLKPRVLRRSRVVTLEPNPDGAAYDLMRTRLLQQARQNGWKTIGFVSPHSGCGKSTSVANLAFSLSRQEETKTLVLDFDLRQRGLTTLLGQKPRKGIAEMLEGRAQFSDIGMRHSSNVAFGLTDKTTKRASEILQSSKTQASIEALQEEYQPDLILFDLPPLMATDDNFGFLNKIDAALILAAAEKTALSQIDIAERQVAELTNVMGIVLNQCRFNVGAYGQDYGYH